MVTYHVGKHWNLKVADEACVRAVQVSSGLPHMVARALVARGVDTPERVGEFLTPSLERDWEDPASIPGMVGVVDALERAVRGGKRIVVFGDFDLDGISSTAVMIRGLHAMGCTADVIIPHRIDEGYGLTDASLERVYALDPDFLITVDCGISGAREVALLLERGIEVAITDHHEPSDGVPVGVPVTDPKLDSACPSGNLAGVGVALKVICLLGQRMGKPDVWRDLVDLATLGTVADLMPLVGENRALVSEGLVRINTAPRPGIAASLALAKPDTVRFSASDLSFSLIPRLNAAGRMGDPLVALDLLLCDDPVRAQDIARTLEDINQQRREVEAELTEQAVDLAQKTYRGQRVLILAGEHWHEGVKGIVASRLANRYGVPVLLFSLDNGEARGSGRSVGAVNLFKAVESCADSTLRFGGHEAAVGVTVATERLDEFRQCMEAHMAQESEESFHPDVEVDAILQPQELTVPDVEMLDRLEPFGQGNRAPIFVSQNVFITSPRAVGVEKNHLSFSVTNGIATVQAVFFHCLDVEKYCAYDGPIDIVYGLQVEEWNGRRKVKIRALSIEGTQADESPDVGDSPDIGENTNAIKEMDAPADDDHVYLDGLFARGDTFLVRERYAHIIDADSFFSKVAGVTFEGRQDIIARLSPDMPLMLVRDADNPYDANAIGVFAEAGQIGFLNKELAAKLASAIDDGGAVYRGAVSEITGGTDGQSLGVNIVIERVGAIEETRARCAEEDLERRAQRALWVAHAHRGSAALTDALCGELLGSDAHLHQAQIDALSYLEQGFSTLTVMATGRGKSLIFHIHAARTALAQNKASIFIFPLRALIADQAFHLTQVFARLGLIVRIITGESTPAERDEVFDTFAGGGIDVLLTTPEFLSIHVERFRAGGRVGFLVVDEAHHVGMSKAGHRPAYNGLAHTRQAFPEATVSAVTATAGDEVAHSIIEALGITRIVLDPTVRSNLSVDDQRNLKDRTTYLTSVVASGEKTVIYVNSREQSMSLARTLRKRLPALGPSIGFYHGGLPRSDRAMVERLFREGTLHAIVSTSAFGEGVNIPDIRHVVLYHLPFNEVEFNQMSGRAGRDGSDSVIHLLYGVGDANINAKILQSNAPSRDDLVTLYRVLKRCAQAEDEPFAMTNAELSEACLRMDPKCKLDEGGVSTGISVFRELELVVTYGYSSARKISVVDGTQKVELTSSIRYLEGCEEIDLFNLFKEWALTAPEEALLTRFNRPILPAADIVNCVAEENGAAVSSF